MRAAGRVGSVPVAVPILLAVIVDFAFEFTLSASTASPVIRVIAFAIRAGIFYFIGRFLGTRTWPKRGRSIARMVLRYNTKKANHPTIFLSDRPDVTPSITRRLVEAVGFAAGASIIFCVALTFTPLATGAGETGLSLIDAFSTLFGLIALWGSFLLVPYWLFGRMGLRQIDPVRWLIIPMARRYADRMRLSNGALILLAFVGIFNLAFRAGANQNEAVLEGALVTVRVVMGVLICAVTAVAYYVRGERALLLEVEEEALRMGIVDGRGMSDGDFLPKLPKA